MDNEKLKQAILDENSEEVQKEIRNIVQESIRETSEEILVGKDNSEEEDQE